MGCVVGCIVGGWVCEGWVVEVWAVGCGLRRGGRLGEYYECEGWDVL